jgi:hypothetical protein
MRGRLLRQRIFAYLIVSGVTELRPIKSPTRKYFEWSP